MDFLSLALTHCGHLHTIISPVIRGSFCKDMFILSAFLFFPQNTYIYRKIKKKTTHTCSLSVLDYRGVSAVVYQSVDFL